MSLDWQVSTKRFLIIGSLLVLCALSIFVGPTKSVSAATISPQLAATSCYGGAVYLNRTINGAYDFGPYYTSSRCNDINLRFSNIPDEMAVDVCWTKYNYCRASYYGYTVVEPGDTSWHVLATNVADGTEFTVHMFPVSSYTASVAGYIAF